MGQFGSFFKGEKKKKKKDQSGKGIFAPVFVQPEIIGKSKKEKGS